MKYIKFSKNWNNKLNCEYFTTIRPRKEGYYNTNEKYKIILNNIEYCQAEIITIEKVRLSNINNRIAFLDAALNKKDFNQLMQKFYSNKSFWKAEQTRIVILTLKRVDNQIEMS